MIFKKLRNWMGSNTEGCSWVRVEVDCIIEKQVAVYSWSVVFLRMLRRKN